MKEGYAMESQDLEQQKLQIILCGPLPQTEAALLRRGDGGNEQ